MVETVRRVVCDYCGKTAPDALESENPVELARADGWLVYDGTDESSDGEESAACPDCINKKN